ncbi:class I SAM-dependent methyltransferase [bacterium]|nr:class I SAM-dependent methyltransferase [bacterium]
MAQIKSTVQNVTSRARLAIIRLAKKVIHRVPLLSAILKERNKRLEKRNSLLLCGAPSEMDRTLYPYPLSVCRDLWGWLSTFANNESFSILEIGSREVVNKSPCKTILPRANYTGFDFYEGGNVDVVGDAHELSSHFDAQSIDVVVSIAVFEHLAMPWIVAEEIAKVLKIGGFACIYTHFSYSEHEEPWHFFQFNNKGLEALFNRSLGFKVVESALTMPMVGRFAFDCDKDHAGMLIAKLYGGSHVIVQKIEDKSSSLNNAPFDWRKGLGTVYNDTKYPPNTSCFTDD